MVDKSLEDIWDFWTQKLRKCHACKTIFTPMLCTVCKSHDIQFCHRCHKIINHTEKKADKPYYDRVKTGEFRKR